MDKKDRIIPSLEIDENKKDIESYTITRVKLSLGAIVYSIQIKKRDLPRSPEEVKKIN